MLYVNLVSIEAEILIKELEWKKSNVPLDFLVIEYLNITMIIIFDYMKRTFTAKTKWILSFVDLVFSFELNISFAVRNTHIQANESYQLTLKKCDE